MKKILFASTRQGAGKTNIIVGVSSVSGKKISYIKPFGDRLTYRWKINWDYDAALINRLWKLDMETDHMTLGYSHQKMRYMYDEDGLKTALNEMADNAAAGKDALIIEGGQDLIYGSSLHFDSISMARYLGCELYIVAGGETDQVLDDMSFLKHYRDLEGVDFKGIIVNKIRDVDEFEAVHLDAIDAMGIPVLGIIPFKEQLTYFTMQYLADKFSARIIAGEKGLNKIVKNIFVGAMSTGESLRNPLFNKENKLLITSGDRSEMILAALESDTSGLILTNNLLPPSNIISKAAEKDVPLLLLSLDTYNIARQMDNIEALLTGENSDSLDMLSHLARKYIKTDLLLK